MATTKKNAPAKKPAKGKVQRNWSFDKFSASVKRNCERRAIKPRMSNVRAAYDNGLSVMATVAAMQPAEKAKSK
jgi:hypothetical protein